MAPHRWWMAIGVAAAVGPTAGCSDVVSPQDAETPADITVDLRPLDRHVAVLAHDSMCGRRAGTRYERMAGDYVARAFERAHLDPGSGGTYFQEFIAGPGWRGVAPSTASCNADTSYASRNVLGIVPGVGALAVQWVIVGAHYDHLGWDTVGGATAVFNGADDNASGTAVVLEMARLFAAWGAAHRDDRGRRSVMFHVYGAEEMGLLGSYAFVDAAPVPLEAVYAMVNLDMVGRLRDGALFVGGAGTASGWPTLVESARPPGLDLHFDDEALERSDQAPFIAHGVPAIHLFTGGHPQYHTAEDDVALINLEGMGQVMELGLALLGQLVFRPAPL